MRDLIQQLQETSINVEQVAAKFLAIVPAKHQELTKRSLGVLLPAYVNGEIYNTTYKDAKHNLSSVLYSAWQEKTDHFWVGRGGDNPESSFLDYIGSPSNLNDILSRKKRLDKLKPTTKLNKYGTPHKGSDVDPAFIQAAREVIDAAHPVALIVKALKTKVIKGRKPNPAAAARKAAELANKDLKTCGCCFRTIARLKNGKTADHGYTLPTRWAKTASCPGRMFKPLEVSRDGLDHMVKLLTKRIASIISELRHTKRTKKLTVADWRGKPQVFTPESPSWESVHNNRLRSLEKELKMTKGDLDQYRAKKRSWRPTEQ